MFGWSKKKAAMEEIERAIAEASPEDLARIVTKLESIYSPDTIERIRHGMIEAMDLVSYVMGKDPGEERSQLLTCSHEELFWKMMESRSGPREFAKNFVTSGKIKWGSYPRTVEKFYEHFGVAKPGPTEDSEK